MWIILIIYLIILSILLSYKLKFKNYKIDFKELFKSDKTSLFLTLGTKIGVGSIVGTASSIIIGGFSSIVWIIIFSFLFTSLIYYESYYGNKYKKKLNNEFVGGPYFIMRYGLNNKALSIISLFLLIIVYSFMFQMIQFNTISYILINSLNISKLLIVLISIIFLFITLNLSINDILNILNKTVPYMCLMFVFTCIIIIFINFNNINFNLFLKDFLSFKSIISGLIIGVKRSIFMNETLIGTTSTAASSDKNNLDLSIKYQIISVYFISIIITILIGVLLLIYMSNNIMINDYNLLIQNVFFYSLGNFGICFLLIIYLLFGITTVLSGYYIGISNVKYLMGEGVFVTIFKILFIISCVLGIILNSDFIWKYLDIFIFIMIIINSYSIIKLVMYDDR